MTNHPNRSKRSPKPGASPSPEQFKARRLKAGLTQPQAAALLHRTTNAIARWEDGTRNMPADSWELFNIKIKEKEMEQLFEVVDGIMDISSIDGPPSREEMINNTEWIKEYADGACDITLTDEQARIVQDVARKWVKWLDKGESLDTCERWAKAELAAVSS